MFNESIWLRLVRTAEVNQNRVLTLSQNKLNTIHKVSEDGFLVETKGDPQLVLKKWISDAWDALYEKRVITADDIPGQARHRSSFIMALFSLLPEVEVQYSKPVSLKLIQQPDGMEYTTWIFQGNPNKFDINKYVMDRRYIWWSLRQKHFEQEIKTGDEVFLWRTESDQPGNGGIIARGIIVGPPTIRTDEEASQYWKTVEWKVPGLGVPVELQEVKVIDGFLPRKKILENKVLQDLLILRMANQTNYKISDVHATELNKLWGKPDVDFREDDEEADLFPEGKRVYRQHRIIERNPHLIKAAKEKFKKLHGELRCMACGFSFVEQYGAIGEDFIEGHHTTPISEMSGEYHAKIENIALVCSNCHRMLHRKRPWIKMVDLKQLLKEKV
jgi:predicted RNA-binding protein with PUA-like domain